MDLNVALKLGDKKPKSEQQPVKKKKTGYVDMFYTYETDDIRHSFVVSRNRKEVREPFLRFKTEETETRINYIGIAPQSVAACDELIKTLKTVRKELLKGEKANAAKRKQVKK